MVEDAIREGWVSEAHTDDPVRRELHGGASIPTWDRSRVRTIKA